MAPGTGFGLALTTMMLDIETPLFMCLSAAC
jgi:hypothetical protein